MATTRLPSGTHYAVAWGISKDYAGMTSAMLHRSRAFVRISGTPVTLLTYDFREDYDAVRANLRGRGDIVDGMTLINLWEDLRTWSDTDLRKAAGFAKKAASTFSPLRTTSGRSGALREIVLGDNGETSQADYYREDGTLLVSDRHQLPGAKSRSVTLCDTTGAPIGTWQSMWRLYHFWLDSLPRDPVAWFIVDSKTAANHFSGYQRPDIVSMYMVHGSHLTGASKPPHGQLVPSRKHAFDNLDKWDAAVFLTKHQCDDVEALLGPGSNRHVCPNGRELPTVAPDVGRDSHRGAMLASLTARKRVDHAVRAMARASGRLAMTRNRRQPHLDVYGDGDLRTAIEELVSRLGSAADVTLHGYTVKASDQLAQASFSLLTSTREGQPLAITESMAAGCIPISYDIPYGPGDVITDGVDGFLVAPGDIRAMSRRIRKVARATPEELAPIRLAAYERAQDFNDEQVTKRWVEIMERTLDNRDATRS